MYRIFSILVIATWLAAMYQLVDRDVLPRWRAQEAPPLVSTPLAPLEKRQSQAAIYDSKGRLIGKAWSSLSGSGDSLRYSGWVWLDRVSMLPPLRVDTSLTFTAEHDIDDFELDVYGVTDPTGAAMKINMKGEKYGAYIPCVLQVGPFRRTLKFEAAASRQIADSIRPFTTLTNLRVGQSWRLQMLDPISTVLNQGATAVPVVAKVETKEAIEHDGQSVECFLVVAGRAKAWVAPDGRVLRQEVDVPGLGRLTVLDELFSQDELDAFKADFGPSGPKKRLLPPKPRETGK